MLNIVNGTHLVLDSGKIVQKNLQVRKIRYSRTLLRHFDTITGLSLFFGKRKSVQLSYERPEFQ